MPCDVQMIGAITRSVSYIVSTIGGVLSIYLGYRLYVRGVDSAVSGSASHAGWSGTLRSTGPGVFLVLFGAIILGTVVFSKANFAEEDSSENFTLTALVFPKAQAQATPAARPGTAQPKRPGLSDTADCILVRKVRKRSTSFINGGALSVERLRAATRASLDLNADARAHEGDPDRMRMLELTRETLEALKAELEPE